MTWKALASSCWTISTQSLRNGARPAEYRERKRRNDLDSWVHFQHKALMTLSIRPATTSDSSLIFDFIRELAEYERLAHEVDASEDDIGQALFSLNPRVFAEIAEWEGEPVGFALWFYNFSTFRGRHGIYLED